VTATIAAAVRVIGGVHNYAADRRAESHVAPSAGAADFDVLVLFVADGAQTCHAFQTETAHFARWHFHHGVIAFFSRQLRARASGSNGLSAAAGL
jgi:hypothetical protein